MNFEAIKKAAQDYRPAMAKFLRDMIAIPSESCQEEGVVRRIAQDMDIRRVGRLHGQPIHVHPAIVDQPEA